MVSEETLQIVTERLVQGFQPQRVILFGSQARGTAHRRSDIDPLVVTHFSGGRRAWLVAMVRCLKGLGIAPNLVLLTPERFERDIHIPGTVARPAAREGRVLYERC